MFKVSHYSLLVSLSHLFFSSGMLVVYAGVGLVVTVIVLALALLVFYRKWRAGNRKSPELSDCLALDNHAAGQVRGFQPCTRTYLYTSTHTHSAHVNTHHHTVQPLSCPHPHSKALDVAQI